MALNSLMPSNQDIKLVIEEKPSNLDKLKSKYFVFEIDCNKFVWCLQYKKLKSGVFGISAEYFLNVLLVTQDCRLNFECMTVQCQIFLDGKFQNNSEACCFQKSDFDGTSGRIKVWKFEKIIQISFIKNLSYKMGWHEFFFLNLNISTIFHPNTDEFNLKKADEIFQHYMKKMLEDPFASDITFQVNGQKILANRNLVARRCPLLADMVQSGSSAEILNTKPEIFKSFLEFIYTNKCEKLPEFCEELLILAYRFEFDELKSVSLEMVMETVDDENARRRLHIAEKLEISSLRSCCSYIRGDDYHLCSFIYF